MMFGLGKKTLDLDAKDKDGKTLREKLVAALSGLPCPNICDDVVEAGIVGGFRSEKGKVIVDLRLPTAALKGRKDFEASVAARAKDVVGGDADVEVNGVSAVKPAAGSPDGKQDLPGIANVILVASGKGGVGKSTVASNLAVALAKLGCKVGLLDADIYGPSAPTMFGIAEGTRPGTVPGPDPTRPKIAPLDRYGVKLMSIGFLVDTSTPMVWRGPMIASAAMQLFKDVAWGELDYLVVDMPPGTGDVQLTISQQVIVSGAVVVSTPQDVALADVVRAKAMFDKVSIPILGVVENMSYFICDQCNKRHEIFFHGGARQASERMRVPFLGEVPLEPGVVAGGDTGKPVVLSAPESASAHSFLALAEEVATSIAKTAFEMPEALAGPTISISGGSLGKGGAKKGGLPIVS
jgi:ATP-binding protein involved in chromosome partitioning